MNGHRTCIICSPRSGSQLCEKLISEIHCAVVLGEYFENWNRSRFELDSNNNLTQTAFIRISSKLDIADNLNDRLDLLTRVNPTNPLVLRIFLMDDYDKDNFAQILKCLQDLGFEFIVLSRNIKDQVLSFMIALSYKVFKNKNVFGINIEINESVFVDLQLLGPIFDNLIKTCVNWQNNLSSVIKDLPYQSVEYETIVQDLENIYKTTFSYQGKKSITVPYMDLINNKDEVTNYLRSKSIK